MGAILELRVALVAAAVLASSTVAMAFFRHAWRFFTETLHLRGTYADRLCFGIFVTAAGSAVAGVGALVRIITDHILPALTIAGWGLMAAGYFFMFCAWHGAILARLAWFRWLSGIALIAFAVAFALIFRASPNP